MILNKDVSPLQVDIEIKIAIMHGKYLAQGRASKDVLESESIVS